MPSKVTHGVLHDLARVEAHPALTILCPLDHRRPGNEQDPVLLARQVSEAAARVREHVADAGAAQVWATRIAAAVDGIDLEHPSPGVAVLLTADSAQLMALSEPVGPRVVLGERFAVRDLLVASRAARRARVLVLSQARSRCVHLDGAIAAEHLADGFPLTVEVPTEADTPHRDFPLDEHEPDEAARFVFRAVDHALAPLATRDPMPLVLVGTDRDLAWFDEVTHRRHDVVGRVLGNHLHESAVMIAGLVAPVLDDAARREEQRWCDEAREALGTHAVSGIHAVWPAARAGRGHRLLVEETFVYSARVVADALLPAPVGDPAALDAADDAVVEVLRHGGEVVMTSEGTLGDLGGIAMITRY